MKSVTAKTCSSLENELKNLN